MKGDLHTINWVNSVKLSFRQQFISDPEVAKSRKEIAEIYRAARKDSPAIARLLRRRVNEAAVTFNRNIFSSSDTSFGGLTALVENETIPSQATEGNWVQWKV
jgi:hypothetical protein